MSTKWSVHENRTFEIHPWEDEDGDFIIAEIPEDAEGTWEEKRKTANLIAAAPELLDMLKRLIGTELAKFDEDVTPEAEALIRRIESTS